MAARLKEKYEKEIRKSLMDQFGLKSIMQVPRIEKIVLNVGMGEAHANAKALETATNELALISGQRPVRTIAKKSIAGFKIREGMILGVMVTLRGDRMYEFFDRLLTFTLPRVRDFNGLSAKSFDKQGNYNFSVKEQIIFPEIDFDKVDTVHGMNISIVTTTQKIDQAKALLDGFEFPFRKPKK